MMKRLIVAIDGPAASGKSSTARRLAESLGYLYIDSGAMYRACALAAFRGCIDLNDHEAITKLMETISIELRQDQDGNIVLLNQEDVTSLIREEAISRLASDISALGSVRTKMVELQQRMGEQGGIVMDGRDIGTVVFPQAEIKFFMIANVDERAKRRFAELQAKGIEADFQAVISDLMVRDENDSSREIAPLKPAADSILIDTSRLSLDEQVRILLQHIKQRTGQK